VQSLFGSLARQLVAVKRHCDDAQPRLRLGSKEDARILRSEEDVGDVVLRLNFADAQ